MYELPEIKFDEKGLVPAIAQDYKSKDVLMLAYMNAESLKKTLETGKAHYFSRSRGSLWQKGETSGHYQLIKGIRYDCDKDAVLLIVEQRGSACHTGNMSCFFEGISGKAIYGNGVFETDSTLNKLYNIITGRLENPKEGSYTNYLFDKGIDKILKKVGEETTEVVIAAKNNNKAELTYEISDLIYHLSVLMVNNGVTWNDICSELVKRM